MSKDLRVWWVKGTTSDGVDFRSPFCGTTPKEVTDDVLLHAQVHKIAWVKIESLEEDPKLAHLALSWVRTLWLAVRKGVDL